MYQCLSDTEGRLMKTAPRPAKLLPRAAILSMTPHPCNNVDDLRSLSQRLVYELPMHRVELASRARPFLPFRCQQNQCHSNSQKSPSGRFMMRFRDLHTLQTNRYLHSFYY
jgi:hypothetical protein